MVIQKERLHYMKSLALVANLGSLVANAYLKQDVHGVPIII